MSDTVHKTILISSVEMPFISSTLFNRLHNISQNSTAYLTFPTNKTKRFEHSLGTMKLCGDMFYYSVCNSHKDVQKKFFEAIEKEIKVVVTEQILGKEDSKFYRMLLGDSNLNSETLLNLNDLNENINNVFYNHHVPHNISNLNRPLFLILFQAIRLSALLHDIGHPPYSHITESAMQRVYKSVNGKPEEDRTAREINFLHIIGNYIHKDGIALHEAMGNGMVEKLIEEHYILINKGPFFRKLFSVLVCSCVVKILKEESPFFSDLHRLIDGPLDGDRLDYVSRDVLNSGFNNGIIEYDRIVFSMKLSEFGDRFLFTPDVKSINTVEDFFTRRWGLYKNIIFHHRVAKTDALLERSIEFLMHEHLKLSIAVSNDQKVLPYDISGLWKAIEFAASNNKYFNNLSQWDDNWLITILKKTYFETYCDEDTNIRYMLEEFLSNRKNYYSLIKSKTDFDILENEIEINIDLEKVTIKESMVEKIFEKKGKYSFLERLNILFIATDHEFAFFDFLKEKTESFIKDNYSNVVEVITLRKTSKTGLETEPYIVKNNKPLLISQVSTIKDRLSAETSAPHFFIYLRYQDMALEYSKGIEILKPLGKYLGECIKIKLEDIN